MAKKESQPMEEEGIQGFQIPRSKASGRQNVTVIHDSCFAFCCNILYFHVNTIGKYQNTPYYHNYLYINKDNIIVKDVNIFVIVDLPRYGCAFSPPTCILWQEDRYPSANQESRSIHTKTAITRSLKWSKTFTGFLRK